MLLFLIQINALMYRMTEPETSPEVIRPGSSIPNPDSYIRWQRFVIDRLYRFNKVEINGQENIPNDKPLLVVATHRGFGDIPAVNEAMLPVGRLRYVAKKEVFNFPLVGKKMETDWNSIKIDRDKPTNELLLDCLTTFEYQEDPYLAIFPEATRKKHDLGTVDTIPSFVARIACYAGVRVLPIGVWGTQKWRNILGFKDMFVAVREPVGPFPISATYDTTERSIDRPTKEDRDIIAETRKKITQQMQLALDQARLLSEK